MKVPFIDLTLRDGVLQDELRGAMDRVVRSGRFLFGTELESFENDFAGYTGSPQCVAVGSGTDALRLSMMALGVGPGDEVILPSLTFVASAFAISSVGAQPVFVEVDPVTCTIDPNRVEEAISPRTRAVMAVHLYGQSAELEALQILTRRHKLLLIEDACQAHGASYQGVSVGTWGDVGCFSFYPTKNLGGCGDGGAVLTRDDRVAERIRSLRNLGEISKYRYGPAMGTVSRMSEIEAAFLRVKLPYLDRWNLKRQQIAETYVQSLSRIPELQLPLVQEDDRHVFHLFVVRTEYRGALQRHLREAEVETLIHYPLGVHEQPFYKKADEKLPMTESLAEQVLSLPIFPDMLPREVDEVIKRVTGFFEQPQRVRID